MHEDPPDNPPRGFRFTHERLVCFQVASKLCKRGRALADSIERRDRRLADQIRRAATSIPLLIAEGANRHSPGAKRQRYREALGECGELAGAVSVCADNELGEPSAHGQLRTLAQRTAALLVGLIESQTRRLKQ